MKQVQIFNPGKLPKYITPENIKSSHDSYPYNPIIANALFKMTYLENWGSGVQRIIDACRAQYLPDPVWQERQGFITVTFQRPKKNQGTTQVRSKYYPSTPQIVELIMHMNGNFMSMKSMMEVCNLKSRKRFREYYVTPALDDNAIERKFPDEPNHPKQMYRLTVQAIEWKNSLKKQ